MTALPTAAARGVAPEPRTAPHRAPAASRNDSLDGLRAIAILVVFAAHGADFLLPGGGIGVQVFFALSGFLITGVLLKEHGRSGRVALGGFFLRRLLRLYPALVAATVLATAVALLLRIGSPLADAAAALTYTTDLVQPLQGPHPAPIGITWSLAVEEQFYLVWPFALLVLLRRPTRTRLAALAVAALTATAGIAVAWHALGTFVTYLLPTTQVPALLAGCALALMPRPWLATAWFRVGGWIGAAVLVLALWGFGYGSSRLMLGGYLVAAVASMLLIGLLAGDASPMRRALEARPLVWLGQRSYGFYLYHAAVLFLAAALPLPLPVRLVLALAVAIGLAAASWRWIERPFLRVKDRLSARAEG